MNINISTQNIYSKYKLIIVSVVFRVHLCRTVGCFMALLAIIK